MLVDGRSGNRPCLSVEVSGERFTDQFTVHDNESTEAWTWFPHSLQSATVCGVQDELADAVERAATGDEFAFAEIVRSTQADVFRACAALVDADAAADLAQETYLRAFRSLERFAGESSVRTWLLGIARHVCLDELRARSRRRRLGRALLPPAPQVSASGAVELSLLIADLPPDRRVAFVMTQVLGLSYEEAAQACGCPIGTIRSRVARARESLLESFELSAEA